MVQAAARHTDCEVAGGIVCLLRLLRTHTCHHCHVFVLVHQFYVRSRGLGWGVFMVWNCQQRQACCGLAALTTWGPSAPVVLA